MQSDLFTKLDLNEYIENIKKLFAREKDIILQGDFNLHFKRIQDLCKVEFNPPQNVSNLDKALMHISKQGILHLDEIFEFIKIIRYFSYLKNIKFENDLKSYIDKIELLQELIQICDYFDEKGVLKESLDERLLNINEKLKIINENIQSEFKKLIYTKSLAPYLIDTQIHYINDSEALLLRGGFNHSLKAKIIGRSSGGGFYVSPLSIEILQKQIQYLKDEKEQIYYEYAKKISLIFHKHFLFLNFINKAFDLFDHYSARVIYAKKNDYNFILASNNNEFILKEFAHPALKNPKLINLEFKKQVLIITGVNAGGKSMLLKSILSATLMAKYLLPMRINSQSKIGSFKELDIILEDPQNAKNDISTFAGRMLHFSKIFAKKDLLLGIDEIELGTDFEEAACLYSVLINELIKQNKKIIITTHHKRLAFLLAKNEQVELIAALYDENISRPKYEFLKGTIGKSYAFETALRYGISANFVAKAKQIYGEDKEDLEFLVSKNINLELELKQKIKDVSQKEEKVDELLQNLKEQKQKDEERINNLAKDLEFKYHKAINEAKKTIILKDTKEKQRSLNKANELKKEIIIPTIKEKEEFKIGDFVKYGKIKGKIVSINKNDVFIESDGIRLRLSQNMLQKTNEFPKQTQKTTISIQKPISLNFSLDLHGLRSDEAIDKLDKFISDALVAGLDEIIIYHGIGTGKLAFAVKEFLKAHKSVKSFSDAPYNQGGFGAKVVRL